MVKKIRTTNYRMRTLVDRVNRSLPDSRVSITIEYKEDGNIVDARVCWSANYRGDNENALEMFMESMNIANEVVNYINYSNYVVIIPDGLINDDGFNEFFEDEYEQALSVGWYRPSLDYLMDVDYEPIIEEMAVNGKHIRRIEEYEYKMERAS